MTIGLLAYLFSSTDVAKLKTVLAGTNLWLLVAYTALMVGAAYIVDTFALSLAFSRFHQRTTMGDLLPVKGASYLLNILNYNAAAGSIALMMKFRRQVSVVEGLGTMLWVSVVDLVIVNAMCLVGGLFVDLGTSSTVIRAVNIGVLCLFAGSCIYWNVGFDFFVLGRLRSWSIFNGFRLASMRDYGAIGLVRLSLILVYTLYHFVVLPLFGIAIPLTHLFAYVPVLAVINIIPIAGVSGLGTGQVVMRALFGGYVVGRPINPVPIVDAYSTAHIMVGLVLRVLIGVVCMPTVSRDLKRAAAESNAAEDS